MPRITERLCGGCNNLFETMRDESSACPHCGNTKTKELVSTFKSMTPSKTSGSLTPQKVLQIAGVGEAGMSCSLCKKAAEITCETFNVKN